MADMVQTGKKSTREQNKELVLAALRAQNGQRVEGSYPQILSRLGLEDTLSITQLRRALDSLVHGSSKQLLVRKDGVRGAHSGFNGRYVYEFSRP